MPRLQSAIGFDGAIVTVRIELGAVEESLLRATGQPVPPPFPTTALIDTGASHSAVHPMILNHLGATQTGTAQVSVPGHAHASLPLYDVRIRLGDHGPAFAVQVAKIVPATHTVAVLIGRDVLKNSALLLDGQYDSFSLWV
jgi:predicted aspartyl protease